MHRAFDRGEKHRRDVQDRKGRPYSAPPIHNKTNSADGSIHRDGSLHREMTEMTGDDGLLSSDQPGGSRTKSKPRSTIAAMDCTPSSSSSSPSSAGGGGGGVSDNRIYRSSTVAAAIGTADAAAAALAATERDGGGSTGGGSTGSSGLYARIGHVLRKSFNGTSNTSNKGMDNMITSSASPGIPAVGITEQHKGTGLGPGLGSGLGLGSGSGQGRQDRISSRSAPAGTTRPEQDNESLTGGGLTRRDGSLLPGESRKGSNQLFMTSSAKYSNKRLSDASLPAVADSPRNSPTLYDSAKRMTRSFKEGKQESKKARLPSSSHHQQNNNNFDSNLMTAAFNGDDSEMIQSEAPHNGDSIVR